MDAGKNFIVGVFDDDDVLMKGVPQVRETGVNIHEVYTPFPVHGLEDVLGYKRSRLPIVAFLFAMTGMTLAITLQVGIMVVDWPMIIGGKPFFAYPDFVPITFELSVLLSALGMVATFLVISDLKPHKIDPPVFDRRSTDDKFIMAVDLAMNTKTEEEISSILTAAGAVEINKKNFDE